MLCSAKFSMTLQTEIISNETSDFLKQMIGLKPFNFVFNMMGYSLLGNNSENVY